MKILDLFCGAGGFSLGFKQMERGDTFVGVDIWDIALDTYGENIGGETILCDINELPLETFGHVDILIGSPPCQGFSTANKLRNKDITLVSRYLEIRDYLAPKWWIMEEVPPVIKSLRENGMLLPGRFLEARDFGLPHRRRRLFAGNYPEPDKHPWNGFLVLTPIAQIRGYGNGKEDREKLKREYDLIPSPMATDWKGFGKSKADRGFGKTRRMHDKFNEIISPEKCAVVMGFPADYRFHGSIKEKYMQIGNAVCPPISRAIYEAILKKKRIEDYFKV